ncbi:MAG: hypothetical protein ABIP94_10270, partial [Planctomycetota bacterium]
FAGPRTFLTGSVRCRGEPLASVSLEVFGAAEHPAVGQTDRDGHYRILVSAGPQRVRVGNTLKGSGTTHRAIYRHERETLVPLGVIEHRCDIDVPPNELAIAVTGALTGVIRPLTFHLEGTAAIDEVRATFELAPTDANTGRYEGMPPGLWTVRAESAWFCPPPAQQFEISRASPNARVEIPVEPAGIVCLDLRRSDGREFAPPPVSMPPLQAGGCSFEAVDVRRFAPVGAGYYGYVSVPPGPARVLLEDREVDGQLTFQPFDAQPARQIEVAAGNCNQVAIFVEPRAQVELRAVDSVGREDLHAVVEVRRGARVVAPLHKERPSLWHAFLPPGEYRVRIDRNGESTEESLVVARANVQRRLRP